MKKVVVVIMAVLAMNAIVVGQATTTSAVEVPQRIMEGARARQKAEYDKVHGAYKYHISEVKRLSTYPDRVSAINEAKLKCNALRTQAEDVVSEKYLNKMIAEETLNPTRQTIRADPELVKQVRAQRSIDNALEAKQLQIDRQQAIVQQQRAVINNAYYQNALAREQSSYDDESEDYDSEDSSGVVYVTDFGDKYHGNRSCGYLNKSSNTTTRDEAEGDGKTPCSRCYD